MLIDKQNLLAFIGLYLFFLSCSWVNAQEMVTVEGSVYSLRELDPPYMAGIIVGISVIKVQELKNPVLEKKHRKKGEVIVAITFTKDGKAVNPKITQSLGKDYDDEAIRVTHIIMGKNWEPGTKDGRPVNVLIEIPFKFDKKDKS